MKSKIPIIETQKETKEEVTSDPPEKSSNKAIKQSGKDQKNEIEWCPENLIVPNEQRRQWISRKLEGPKGKNKTGELKQN